MLYCCMYVRERNCVGRVLGKNSYVLKKKLVCVYVAANWL